LLGNRKFAATLTGETLEGCVARGCSQVGVLLPLLWSLVVDEIIGRLSENGYYMLGYADDIVTLVSGKFLYTVPELLQEALSMVQQWCDRTLVSINPQKLVIVSFKRKRYLRGLKEPTVSGRKLHLTAEVNYLRRTLDEGFTWKTQLRNVINKAYRAFWTCRGTFGKIWDLKPQVLH
jgi:hypothetical protein